MAYQPKNLELLAGGGGGISVWGYVTNDAAATVDTAGYFNQAAGMLRVGDRIHLNADMDGTPSFGTGVVISNDGAAVDIADVTALTATDTR